MYPPNTGHLVLEVHITFAALSKKRPHPVSVSSSTIHFLFRTRIYAFDSALMA